MLVYINDGRLSSATDGTNSYNLSYDALERCVTRTLNGMTTYYVYDGEKPILEYSATEVRRYRARRSRLPAALKEYLQSVKI